MGNNLLFQDSDFVSRRSDLPIVQNVSDILPSTNYESDAYGHWALYKGSEDAFIDQVNNRALNLQMNAAIAPVFSSEGVTLTNAKGSALISDLVDKATTSITAVYVAKTSTVGLYLLGMTLPNTGSTTENGFGAYAGVDNADQKPKVFLNLKPVIANQNGSLSNLSTKQVINPLEPFLVAISVDKAKKTALLYVMQGETESFISATYTGNYEDSTKPMAVGNAYYNAAESGTRTTFAEAILYNKAKTLNQIKAIAYRCKSRLKRQNITL
ncbi:hypothetical protein [Acinetobacter baumannii]|uniref:hypothetical protein n=1 Tax=Acinetobacter baumannii TaxID=470 RepID=UPI003F5F3856